MEVVCYRVEVPQQSRQQWWMDSVLKSFQHSRNERYELFEVSLELEP